MEPMNRLQFEDVQLKPKTDREAMLQQLDAHLPGNCAGYHRITSTAVSAQRY
jgi:hypothetical protein